MNLNYGNTTGSITTTDSTWTDTSYGLYSTSGSVTFETSPSVYAVPEVTPPIGPESSLEWLDRRVREVTREAWAA